MNVEYTKSIEEGRLSVANEAMGDLWTLRNETFLIENAGHMRCGSRKTASAVKMAHSLL